MGWAMIGACVKTRLGVWNSSSKLDYCGETKKLLASILVNNVDLPGKLTERGLSNNRGWELMPGDSWDLDNSDPSGITNLSYFSPGYLAAFAKFSGRREWLRVRNRNYQLLHAAQRTPENCSGLLPNWSDYQGRGVAVNWATTRGRIFGWEAARAFWRLAVDKHWYDSPQSTRALARMAGFVSGVGFETFDGEYFLDGKAVGRGRYVFFNSLAAVGLWFAPRLVTPNCGDSSRDTPTFVDQYELLRKVVTMKETVTKYYGDAWRLRSTTTHDSDFPNFLELED